MGYANPFQIGHGIHMRLYSRAFVFVDPTSSIRFAFVSVDCGMISQIVKTKVSFSGFIILFLFFSFLISD